MDFFKTYGPPVAVPVDSSDDADRIAFQEALKNHAERPKTSPPEFIAVVGATVPIVKYYVLLAECHGPDKMALAATMPVEAENLAINGVAYSYFKFVDVDMVPIMSSLVIRLTFSRRCRPAGHLTYEITESQWRLMSKQARAAAIRACKPPERIFTDDGHQRTWRLEFFPTLEALNAKADYLENPYGLAPKHRTV